jgi:hypothetical protein
MCQSAGWMAMAATARRNSGSCHWMLARKSLVNEAAMAVKKMAASLAAY